MGSLLTAQINTFPFFTDFEAESLCGTSCVGSCNLSGNWKNAVQFGLPPAGTRWLSEDGSTPSADTGPDFDHTLGNSAGRYVYVETSGCNNTTADLVSAQLDFTNLTLPAVEFWYHMYGATMGTLQVDVSTNGGASFTTLEGPFTDHENAWQRRIVSLAAYAGMPDVRIRFHAMTGTSFTSDMALDDISVYDCNLPNIEINSIQLANGSCFLGDSEHIELTFINQGCFPLSAGTNIDVSFTVNGGTPINETFVLAADLDPNNSVSIAFQTPVDFSGGIPYQVNATADIPNNIPGLLNFNEDFFSGTKTYPYLQDFESGADGWLIDNFTGTSTLALGTPMKPVINSAHSGSNAWVTNLTGSYVDNENGAVESPCFDFTQLVDAQFSAWIWWNCEFSWDGAVLQSSIDGGGSWQNVGNFGDPNNWYTDNTIAGAPGGSQSGWSGRNSTSNGSGGWVLASHDISHLAGISPVYLRIAFGTDGSVVDDGFAFDDINIDGTCATADADGDGQDICHGDCDDNDNAVYAGAVEICDGKDNDCDGLVDEDLDCDQDGDGYAVGEGDCDDNNMAINPGATETCNNIDDDCDELIDNADPNLVDNELPTVTCKTPTLSLDGNGQVSILPSDVYDSGFDNCGTVNIVSVSPNSFSCIDVGSNTVTLTVNDGHGNENSCTAEVTVEDQVNPVANCQNLTVQLNGSGVASITSAQVDNGSGDACGILSMSLDITDFDCSNIGQNAVVLTVTDVNNNAASCTSTVTVQDNIAPQALCQDLSVALQPDGLFSITAAQINAGSSDACGILTMSVSPSTFYCNQTGANSVTLTVKDVNNNTSTCSATVTVAPFIVINSITVTVEHCNDADGSIVVDASALGGQLGYSINGGATYQFSNTFTGLPAGSYHLKLLAYGTLGCALDAGIVTVVSVGSNQTWYKDFDGDGYSDGVSIQSCTQPQGYYLAGDLTATTGDCNDTNPSWFPGQIWYKDLDNDGYTNGAVLTSCSQPAGYKLNAEPGDCNDTNSSIHPGAAELCNGLDDDCDGIIDDNAAGGLTYNGNVVLGTQAQVNAWSPCYSVINGTLTIKNAGVDSITALINLVKVTGNVTIDKTSLDDLHGLDNLQKVGGWLSIQYNNTLDSLAGLEELDTVSGALKVFFNTNLTHCCAIKDLINEVSPKYVGGAITIFNNKTGCDNIGQINTTCNGNFDGNSGSQLLITDEGGLVQPGMVANDPGKEREVHLFPNPALGNTNLLLLGKYENGSVSVFDFSGRTLIVQQLDGNTSELQLDINNWQAGIYMVYVRMDDSFFVQKLIVR